MKDLEGALIRSMRDTAKKLAAAKGISLDEAKQELKSMSFAEYMLLEAVPATPAQPIGPNGPTGTSGTQEQQNSQKPDPEEERRNFMATILDRQGRLDPNKTYQASRQAGFDKMGIKGFDKSRGTQDEVTFMGAGKKPNTLRVKPKTGPEYEMDIGKIDMDDKMMAQGLSSGSNRSIFDPVGQKGKEYANQAKSQATRAVKSFLQQESVDPELQRMLQLAGITETASAGATGAGAIATAPSIVGNTSTKPTERLRKRLRLKKEKKK